MQNLWNSDKPKHVLIVGVVFVALAILVDLVFTPGSIGNIQKFLNKEPRSLSGMYFDIRNISDFGAKAGKNILAPAYRDPESQIVHTSEANQAEGQVDHGPEYRLIATSTEYIESSSAIVGESIAPSVEELRKRPQFVVMAFDGSRSLRMWERTLNFADDMKAKGYPIHYTYFLNAVYFLDPEHYSLFQAPHQKAGVSNIGFATSKSDVLARIREVNRAISSGHEIGSHNAGHFEGSRWTYNEWFGQLASFDSIILGLNTIDSEYQIHLKKEDITGFRAPELAVNANMYKALKDIGYTYDTSKIGSPTDWPKKDAYGLWQFSLPTILVKDPITHKSSYTIGMDYNFYVMQTGARDTLRKGTPRWDSAYQSVLSAYRKYFYTNYNGNHAPVYIANHFSYWNDGLYFEVMKDLASEVCALEGVQCVSFKELEKYMNSVQ